MSEPGIEGDVSRLAAVWWPVFRAQPVTVKHAIRVAYATAVSDPATDALRQTLLSIAASDVADGFVSPHRLGRFLVRAARHPVPVATGLPGYPTAMFVELSVERSVKVWRLLPELNHEAAAAA